MGNTSARLVTLWLPCLTLLSEFSLTTVFAISLVYGLCLLGVRLGFKSTGHEDLFIAWNSYRPGDRGATVLNVIVGLETIVLWIMIGIARGNLANDVARGLIVGGLLCGVLVLLDLLWPQAKENPA